MFSDALRVFFILIFFSIPVFSQELIFEDVSSKINLPSAECYNVTQDRNGYIWIATEQGLLRYGRAGTKLFASKQGLPEKGIYASLEDQSGKLWILSSTGRVLFLKGDTLLPTKLQMPQFDQRAQTRNQAYALNAVGKELTVHSSRITYSLDTQTLTFKPVPPLRHTGGIVFLKRGKQLIPLNSNHLLRGDDQDQIKLTDILIKDGKREINIPIPFTSLLDIHWRILTREINGENYISIGNKFIQISKDFTYRVYELPSSIISLYGDQERGLWVGTVKKGLYYFPQANLNKKPLISLNGLSVSGVLEDREGNVWCTTLEDGVFFSRNKRLQQYNDQPELLSPATYFTALNGKFYVSTARGGLYTFHREQGFQSVNPAISEQVFFLIAAQKGYIMGRSSETIYTNARFQKTANVNYSFLTDVRQDVRLYACTEDTTRQRFYISHDRIFRASSNKIEEFAVIRSAGKSVQYLNANTLLIGCANGLYSLDISSRKQRRIKGVDQMVTTIHPAENGEMWITTKGDGLYLLKNGYLKRMDKALKLKTDVFYDVTTDKRGRIWVGSNIGLIRINTRGETYTATLFDVNSGMPANEIYKVAVFQDQLFLSSNKGVSAIPVNDDLIKKIAPLFALHKVETNNEPVVSNRHQQLRLPYRNSNLKLTFGIFSYRNDNYGLIYRIKDDQPFLSVKGDQIALQNLKADRYTLTVYALDEEGLKSEKPIVFSFTVAKPFWQTSWFVGIAAFVLISLFWLFRKIHIRRIEKKEREKTRINTLIAQSKLTALQARMNPHFIFNAINSIQNFILKDQSEAAQNYLTKFSRLVRLVLRQSGEKAIPLSEEIDTLHLYIGLEKLRFKQAFDYEISVEPGLNLQTIYLPTMLIQPYVENAIWHGLMNLKAEREGKLTIAFYADGDALKVKVEDNGIGRARAAAFSKEKGYASAGMMLTQERLNTLKHIFPDGNFVVQISDLELGTRVEITLSLSHDYVPEEEITVKKAINS